MSSATEAELAGLYIMAREGVYIRIILEELGHKQPPTPLQTDNSMVDAVINGKIQTKRNKSHGHEISLATRPRMPTTTSQDDIVDLQQLIVTLSPYSYSLHYN
jgi:hypothetical protein